MLKSVLTYLAIIVTLSLTAFNLNSYTTKKEVLGTYTEKLNKEVEMEFWDEFMEKNPSYIPGWIELGRLDKVKEIDPNYFLLP